MKRSVDLALSIWPEPFLYYKLEVFEVYVTYKDAPHKRPTGKVGPHVIDRDPWHKPKFCRVNAAYRTAPLFGKGVVTLCHGRQSCQASRSTCWQLKIERKMHIISRKRPKKEPSRLAQ